MAVRPQWRRPVFELLEQRAMLTTVYSPAPSTTDGNTGSLRADLALANADTGTQPDIIQLSAGTYNLTSGSGELSITNTTHPIIIDGAGMGQTTIDQQFTDRVFNIAAGATVIFENLEITGGVADTDTSGGTTEADGGGILNLGTLTLTSVEVDHNSAQETTAGENAAGGGIYSTGELMINGGSVISDNRADGATGAAGATGGYARGGGVYADTASAVTISDTTIGGNDALAGSGGAGSSTAGGTAGIAYGGGLDLLNNGTTNFLLSDDTIAGNTASGGNGGAGAVGFDGGSAEFAQGGGLLAGGAAPITIVGSTISTNVVTGGNGGALGTGGTTDGIGGLAFGGGIEVVTNAGSQMLNDTVYGNTATGGTGSHSGDAYGGGIDDVSGGLTIVNVTVTANTAAVVAPSSGGTTGTPFGGGIDNDTSETPGDPALDLYSVLDAGNTAAGSPDFSGAAATAGYNLLGDGTGASGFSTASDHNQVGTSGAPINPLFSASGLTNNGGSTNTITLQTGSPALGAGNVAAAISFGLTTDQRGTGFPRVVNNAVDIGAVEAQSASATSVGVNLSSAIAATGVIGITTDGTTVAGEGLDGDGYTLSANALGTSTIVSNGVTFTLGAPNVPDALPAAGQPISVSGSYSAVAFLAVGTNGNQPGQTFLVNYTNGTTVPVVLSISDWYTPQGYSDQSIAATAAYRNTTDGKRDTRFTSPFYIYGFAIPVDPNETLASITLPNDTDVKILSMVGVASPPVSAPFNLAATYSAADAAPVLTWTAPTSGVIGYNVYRGTASGGESTTPINTTILPAGAATYTDNSTFSTSAPVAGNTYYYVVQAVNGPVGLISNQSAAVQIPGTSPVEVDLSGEYNLEGIVASGSTFSGGLDGGGHALDATALATAAAADLPSVIASAIGPAGANDVVQARGQTIGLPNGSYSAVKLLMTAVNGNQPNQTFTVHYADGTNAQITQGVSDWFTPQNYSNNEAPVGPMKRDTSSGTSDNRSFYVYLDQFPLDGTKTISSITLPNNENVEILAMAMVQ